MLIIGLIIGGVVLAGVGLAIGIYNFFEGETLLRDCWDEFALGRKSLQELDQFCASNPNRSDIVVSLTTIPSRIGMMAPTLKSLLRQTKAPAKIILNLPGWSKRENCAYDIPSFLQGLKCVEIRACDDLGPATKLLPSLKGFPADTKIVALDDDRIYPAQLIAQFSRYAEAFPDAALCFSGWNVPSDLIDRPTTIASNFFMAAPAPIRCRRLSKPKPIDILQGVSAYLVRPRFFNLDEVFDYSKAPAQAFTVDDVWISAHCHAPKLVIPSGRSNYQSKLTKSLFKRSSLGLINRGPGDPLLRSNTIVLRHFAKRWTPGGTQGNFTVKDIQNGG